MVSRSRFQRMTRKEHERGDGMKDNLYNNVKSGLVRDDFSCDTQRPHLWIKTRGEVELLFVAQLIQDNQNPSPEEENLYKRTAMALYVDKANSEYTFICLELLSLSQLVPIQWDTLFLCVQTATTTRLSPYSIHSLSSLLITQTYSARPTQRLTVSLELQDCPASMTANICRTWTLSCRKSTA